MRHAVHTSDTPRAAYTMMYFPQVGYREPAVGRFVLQATELLGAGHAAREEDKGLVAARTVALGESGSRESVSAEPTAGSAADSAVVSLRVPLWLLGAIYHVNEFTAHTQGAGKKLGRARGFGFCSPGVRGGGDVRESGSPEEVLVRESGAAETSIRNLTRPVSTEFQIRRFPISPSDSAFSFAQTLRLHADSHSAPDVQRAYERRVGFGGAYEHTLSGLFPSAARINHKCRDANAKWLVKMEDENLQGEFGAGNVRLELTAMRAIRPGEEITVEYTDLWKWSVGKP